MTLLADSNRPRRDEAEAMEAERVARRKRQFAQKQKGPGVRRHSTNGKALPNGRRDFLGRPR